MTDDLRDAGARDIDVHDAAMVIGIASGRCRVFHHGRELDCVVPSEIAARQKSAIAVGDRVVTETADGVCRLAAILPRRTVLSRPDPINPHRQRLIAANIDVVIHVVSVRKPPLRPRLIDRYLIAIQRGGAQPLICVNKIDLVPPEERGTELAPLETYRALDVPVIDEDPLSGGRMTERSNQRCPVEGPHPADYASGRRSSPEGALASDPGSARSPVFSSLSVSPSRSVLRFSLSRRARPWRSESVNT